MVNHLVGPPLFISLFLLYLNSVRSEILTYKSLDTISYPKAVCNDGSTAGYYISSPSTSAPKHFFIYLESGGWCYDKSTCDERNFTSYSLMTSTMNPDTRDIGGIFDASVLDDYLKVYVHYCTSDGHMGDTDATGSVGYIFRGSEVVHAVVQTLEDDWGITSSAETERVLFGGASAGGRGGMVHLDYVREKYAPVEVVGILDSPLWVDLDPPDFSSKIGLAEQTMQVYSMVQPPEDVLGVSCQLTYSSEPWKCIFGAYRIPFLETNYMLVSAQFDSYQLGQDLDSSKPQTAREIAFADSFGEAMKNTFATLEEVPKIGWLHYSLPCFDHAISTSSSFFSVEDENGVTWEKALSLFLDDVSANVDLVDKCSDGYEKCTSLSGCVRQLWSHK